MSTTYTYTHTDFVNTSEIELTDFQEQVIALGLSSAVVSYVNYNGGSGGAYTIDVVFDNQLSSIDETSLDNLVTVYSYTTHSDTIAVIKDIKPVGTNGGSFTKDIWVTRDLNTLEGDVGFVTLENNQMTIKTGTYMISVKAIAGNVKNHQVKLRNITDSTDIMGTNSYSWVDSMSASEINTVLTINNTKVFEVQHICSFTASGTGFGRAVGFSSEEVYTTIIIHKIS